MQRSSRNSTPKSRSARLPTPLHIHDFRRHREFVDRHCLHDDQKYVKQQQQPRPESKSATSGHPFFIVSSSNVPMKHFNPLEKFSPICLDG
mmetsp:Transcript_7566/g.15882  ORF Transcript_7566/g.15882 Transcript_7566/m.15882 type:complete len:91 (-) Transcript_7566:661-933(-)